MAEALSAGGTLRRRVSLSFGLETQPAEVFVEVQAVAAGRVPSATCVVTLLSAQP